MADNTDRERRIAEGIGLIAAGTTERDAAAAVGLPKTTLHRRYVQHLGPDAPNKDEDRKRADESIMATAYLVAHRSLVRMADELDQADHRGLTAFADTASRVLGRLRGWDKGIQRDDGVGADRLSALVSALAGSGMEAHVHIVPSREQQLAEPASVIDVKPE